MRHSAAIQSYISRRSSLSSSVLGLGLVYTDTASAATTTLSSVLEQRDALLLKKPILNVPPASFEFPDWLLGEWKVDMKFQGYDLCASRIEKERLIKNTDIPGFQKLSIAEVADVGKENVSFDRRYFLDSKNKVREDRSFNWEQSIGAHLVQPEIVKKIAYNPTANPNRATIELLPGSRNGERLELFTNARRSEMKTPDLFLAMESIRQVTFGPPTFSNPGVPRIVIGEYSHWWTFRRLDSKSLRANLLTAAYIEPQDPMFSDAFDEPVVVYSHNLLFSPS